MTIFEIDRQILEMVENSVDPETGELVLDEEKLEKLSMEKDRKIENLLMLYKDTLAQADAIKSEVDALAERQKSLMNKAERLKTFAGVVLRGEPFETAKVKVSYKNSESVETTEEFIAWAKANRDDLLRYKEPEADKKKIKEALKNGDSLRGASIVTKQGMQIK